MLSKSKFQNKQLDYKRNIKEQSKIVVNELRETGKFNGLEMIEEKIESTPSIQKKLVRIARIGNHRTIDDKIIKKMKTVCNRYGVKLNVKEGKLSIEEEARH